MNKSFSEGKEEIVKLCSYFKTNHKAFLAPGVKEAHVRQTLIDPLFEALGWDVRNTSMAAPQYREVVPEDSLEVEGHQQAPDYAFRVGTIPKFFAEAKKCGVDIGLDQGPAYQLRSYGWSAKVGLSILTDFEELSVYDCSFRPRQNDKAGYARIHYFRFEEYPEKWHELWDVFSREAVWSGAFDEYAASKRKRGTSEVDAEFLKEIEGWRDSLARHMALRNNDLGHEDLSSAVQRTIDRIVFLRMAEDRGLEPYGQLLRLCDRDDIYSRFMGDLCRRADEKYNSGLFHFQKEPGVPEAPDKTTPRLAVDDKVFKPILQSLYFEHGSPYRFKVLAVEILGTIYERFLGKVIRLTAGHQAKIEEKPEVRKAGGVYYTPAYIVNYIVEQTVGQLIKGRSPSQLSGGQSKPTFRVLDMACGSGSFLLGAYQRILDHCLKWYVDHKPETAKKAVYLDPSGQWRLTITEKKRILTTHIYGVDIDPQAVEVSRLSLLLKALEGESDITLSKQFMLFHDRALPNLAANIKCGNSLIGTDYSDGRLITEPEELRRIRPFEWKSEFPTSADWGFDCVIGNPPYVQIENIPKDERDYFTSVYSASGKLGKRYDLYQVFLMRAIRQLAQGGYLGYILPNTFLMGRSYEFLRNVILEASCIREIVDLPQGVFEGVTVDNVLLFLQVESNEEVRNKTKVVVKKLNSKSAKTRVTTGNWDEMFDLLQSKIARKKGSPINIHLNSAKEKIFGKMEAKSIPLGKITTSSQGIILYKTEADAKRSEYTGFEKKAGWKNLLRGKNIGRYQTKWAGEFVNYGPWLWCPRDELFFTQPKILLHAMRNKSLSRRLVGTLDEDQYYNAHNLANICSRDGSDYSLKYILGLFNSRLVNFWYKNHFPNVNINPNDFRQIPIRKIDFSDPEQRKAHDGIVSLVGAILTLNKRLLEKQFTSDSSLLQNQIDAKDTEIDRLVYELYGLTGEDIMAVEKDENVLDSGFKRRGGK